jgi:hypothetical protein
MSGFKEIFEKVLAINISLEDFFGAALLYW